MNGARDVTAPTVQTPLVHNDSLRDCETLRLVSPSHCAVLWAGPNSIVLHTVLYQQLLTDGNQCKSSKVKVWGQEMHVRSDLNV